MAKSPQLEALVEQPFELLKELERRSRLVFAGGQGSEAQPEEWVGIGFRLGSEQFVANRNQVREILMLPDVVERVELYFEHFEDFEDQIVRCSMVHDNLVVLDLTGEETIYAGNRFIIYALYPECNISIYKIWGLNRQNTVFAIGKSIIDRSYKINIGELCLSYEGGGHHAAGTCQIDNDQADKVLKELIAKITNDSQ